MVRTAEVLVVAASTAEVLAMVPEAQGLLTEAEATRAAALRFDRDRDDFVASHVLARCCVSTVLQAPLHRLTWQQRCATCGGPHGRPAILEAPDLGVSLAHARGYVAAAAGPGLVGVDVEPADRGRRPRDLAPAVLSGPEASAVDAAADPDVAFLRQWVRREALIKVGVLTLDTLRSVDLSQLPVGEPPRGWAEHSWGGFVLADWRAGPSLGAVAASRPARLRPLASLLPLL